MASNKRRLWAILGASAAALALGAQAQVTPISQLPSATTPLAGTELVPVVQGGHTRKVAASAFATGSLLGSPNTWGATQTFSVAPVFTDAAGSRSALGLGSAATQASTAFAPATSGSSILSGNGAGGFSAVTIGSGLTFSGGTLTATSGGGTVTTTGTPATGNLTKFSGASSITNGDLSGDCTTAGALALTCTKTNGVAFGTAATASTGTSGATIPLLNAANTWSATQTFNGASGTLAAILANAGEPATISATAATGTINYDVTTQSVLYYTTSASANWTLNIRGNVSTSLNSLMATGQAVTIAFLVTQGASPFYNNVVQVDGTTTGVTMKWQGGAPAAGNASGVDVYTYTVIKTGSATYTVLATQVQFK